MSSPPRAIGRGQSARTRSGHDLCGHVRLCVYRPSGSMNLIKTPAKSTELAKSLQTARLNACAAGREKRGGYSRTLRVDHE